MLRLFLAVDLPEVLRQDVARMCTDVTHARWTKSDQLHITLRFMGKTPDEALPEIRRRLSGIRVPAFELALSGAGTFPERARVANARVLWLGIHCAGALADLKRAIDERVEGLAPPEEKASFSPHLTLARFSKRPDDTLKRFLDQHSDYQSASWKVACFRLYKSTLSSEGALHEIIDVYRLVEDEH